MANFTTEGTPQGLAAEVSALKVALHLTLKKLGDQNVKLVADELRSFVDKEPAGEIKTIFLKVAKQLQGQ